MKKRKEYRTKDKYLCSLILVLGVLHMVCNLGTGIISFATDEFIPLAIAAKYAGLDWLNARVFDSYYGYLTLILFIPFFKCSFVCQNTFLLTQCILMVNSIIHIGMSIYLYKALIIINKNKVDREIIFYISLISTCILQVFVIGMGAQVESLFVFFYVLVFYLLLKAIYGINSKYDFMLMGLFSCLAYINNSRGIVLIISTTIIVLIYYIVIEKSRSYLISYIGALFFSLIIHRCIFKPLHMQFFINTAKNTDSMFIVSKAYNVVTSFDSIIALVKTIIGWGWSLNVSTYGILFVALMIITYKCVICIRLNKRKDAVYTIYILLNFIGTIAITSLSVVTGAENLLNMVEGVDRADILIYTRYMVSVLPYTLAIGLNDYVITDFFSKNSNKFLGILGLDLLGKIFYVNVAIPIDGVRYGVNNTVFLSLIQQNYQKTYRYGNIRTDYFWIAQIIVMFFAVLLLFTKKNKVLLVKGISFAVIITCIIYVGKVTTKRSDYYMNIFDKSIIEYCNNADVKSVYISGNADVGQYLMPEKVVYFEDINTQDILIVSPKKDKEVDKGTYHMVLETEKWRLYKKL